MSEKKPQKKSLLVNRRARFEFEFIETLEAGIELVGSEVKSLREGKAQFGDAFADFVGDELFLRSFHISEFEAANRQNHEPMRPRRLLLHRNELDRLKREVKQGGHTIVPTEVYLWGQRIKVEIALARGKKLHDKRESIKERESKREMARARD